MAEVDREDFSGIQSTELVVMLVEIPTREIIKIIRIVLNNFADKTVVLSVQIVV